MKFGFVSLPLAGHLNPMTALARKLQSRGNEVAVFGVPDVEPIVRAANLNFVLFCEKEYPVGSMTEIYGRVAKLHWRRRVALLRGGNNARFSQNGVGMFPKKARGVGR